MTSAMIDEIKDDVHIFIYYISPLDIGCFIGSHLPGTILVVPSGK